jgi:hypothetical protein
VAGEVLAALGDENGSLTIAVNLNRYRIHDVPFSTLELSGLLTRYSD